jgi:tRNA uridine 5-carboxymethylaminomethyl modification enzyme
VTASSGLHKKISDLFKKDLPERSTLDLLFRWPEMSEKILKTIWGELGWNMDFESEVFQTALADLKYAGYITRYTREIKKMADYARIRIPLDLDYAAIKSLSAEVREKLTRHRPETLAQALAIPGITPAATSHIEIHLASRSRQAL